MSAMQYTSNDITSKQVAGKVEQLVRKLYLAAAERQPPFIFVGDICSQEVLWL